MTEQQRPDEDVEGHAYKWNQDTEAIDEDQVADDTQGHIRYSETEGEASEHDVKGHGYRWGQDAEAVDEDQVSDDVGGHQMPRRPL